PPPLLSPYTTLFRSRVAALDRRTAEFAAHRHEQFAGPAVLRRRADGFRGEVVADPRREHLEAAEVERDEKYPLALGARRGDVVRSEEHTSELQSLRH